MKDLTVLRVPELKQRLKKLGQKVSGTKPELIERLQRSVFAASRNQDNRSAKFKAGDRVKAKCPKRGGWYSAEVLESIEDGYYLVSWEGDGSTGECSADHLRGLKTHGCAVEELHVGQRLWGNVTSVRPYGVFVDVGAERDGLVATRLGDKPIELGQQLSVIVKAIREDWTFELSLSQSRSRPTQQIQELVGSQTQGTVVLVNAYGAWVDVGEMKRGLIPNRRSSNALTVTVGQQVEVHVKRLRFDGAFELALTSKQLHVGQKLSGIVCQIKTYGVFVDVGASRNGLLVFRRLSQRGPEGTDWTIGQELNVRVTRLRENGDVELALDEEEGEQRGEEEEDDDDDQEPVATAVHRMASELSIGEELRGRVAAVVKYGAFVDVGADRNGLLPLSSIMQTSSNSSTDGRLTGAAESLEVGQRVTVWVRRKHPDGAFELSVGSRVKNPDVSAFLDLAQTGTFIEGSVVSLTEHGVFVRVSSPVALGNSIDGLIRPGDADVNSLRLGQKVQVRVKLIDDIRNKVLFTTFPPTEEELYLL